MTNEEQHNHLEPRVARLETSMEALTRNVDSLTNSVGQLSKNIDEKFSTLQVGLANANAPKRTDWSVIIAAMGLILALGAAVLIPLNAATNDNKVQIERYHESMVEHQKLDMHPVGMSEVNALIKSVDATKAELVSRDAALDQKIQRETQLMTDLVSAKIVDLDVRLQREMTLINDRNVSRLTKIEERDRSIDDGDRDELRRWRLHDLK